MRDWRGAKISFVPNNDEPSKSRLRSCDDELRRSDVARARASTSASASRTVTHLLERQDLVYPAEYLIRAHGFTLAHSRDGDAREV